MGTNGGYNRLINGYFTDIKVITYKRDPNSSSSNPTPVNTPSRVIPCGYLETFKLYDDEEFVQFQFVNEYGLTQNVGDYRFTGSNPNAYFNNISDDTVDDDQGPTSQGGTDNDSTDPDDTVTDNDNPVIGTSDAGKSGPNLAIHPYMTDRVTVRNCYIHHNGRGGIAVMSNNLVIESCTFDKVEQFGNTLPGTDPEDLYIPPTFTTGSTNYHINAEDVLANSLTIRNSTFYGSSVMFPTLLKLTWDNNIYYGGVPSIGNCIFANMTNSKFINSSGLGTGANRIPKFETSVSKSRLVRNINYTNCIFDNVYGCDVSNIPFTKTVFTNCQINVHKQRQINAGLTKNFRTKKLQGPIFINCTIDQRGLVDNSLIGYYDTLINCTIKGNSIYSRNVQGCTFEDAILRPVGHAGDEINGVVHNYIKDCKGITLKCTRQLPTESLAGAESKSYNTHFVNCEVDISSIDTALIGPTGGTYTFNICAYVDNIYTFDNCKFIGQRKNSTITSTSWFKGPAYKYNGTYYRQLVQEGDYWTVPSGNNARTDIYSGMANMFAHADEYSTISYQENPSLLEGKTIKPGVQITAYDVDMHTPHKFKFICNNCEFDIQKVGNSYKLFYDVPFTECYYIFNNCKNVGGGHVILADSDAVIAFNDSGDANSVPYCTPQYSTYYDESDNKMLYRTTPNVSIFDLWPKMGGNLIAESTPLVFKDAMGNEVVTKTITS